MSDWQPMGSEPKDGTVFDVWAVRADDLGGGMRIPSVRYASTLDGLKLCGSQNVVSPWLKPTHWRPLPEPPALMEA